jgi:hypothetical protein
VQALGRRLAEAVGLLGSIDGVSGLILGGGVGRDEAWPLSDVDIVVVYADGARDAAVAELERRRARIEDFWGWCGVSGSLDLGALWFTESEAAAAVATGPAGLAARTGEERWFHAMDRAYRGRVELGRQPVVAELSALLTSARFAPEVVAARVGRWADRATAALAAGDVATAAEALLDLSTERWGGRSGAYGRRWSRFEAFASRHGHADVAETILAGGGARVGDVAPRLAAAPWWLRHRSAAALAARLAVGERVTPEQNARDQLVAFAHLWGRRGLPPQPWTEPTPPPTDAVGRLRELLPT